MKMKTRLISTSVSLSQDGQGMSGVMREERGGGLEKDLKKLFQCLLGWKEEYMTASGGYKEVGHMMSLSENEEHQFVQEIGWKDESELQDLVRTIHSLLVYGVPPPNGWTWFKFHKSVYNMLKASSTRPIRLEDEYKDVWNSLRNHFHAWLVGKDALARPGVGPSILTLLEELKLHIAGHHNVFDVFAEEKTRVWNCEKWMFPITVREKFPSQEKGGSPLHTSLSTHAPSQSIKDNFSGSPLIIANGQLPIHIAELWDSSGDRFCADGGANRIFDWYYSSERLSESACFVPSAIIGDLDSVRPDVASFYESKGTAIIQRTSQDNTDLDKTLHYYTTLPQSASSSHLMITGALGGNVSQEFANYNTCWRYQNLQFAFIGDIGLILYLAPGKHVIRSASGLKCGIIPLGEPCASITTTGLKWNLGTLLLILPLTSSPTYIYQTKIMRFRARM